MSQQAQHALYDGFASADPAGQDQRRRFLDAVAELPEIRGYRRDLRALLAPEPGDRVLEVGCGVGSEACRLAADRPDVTVLGLDRPGMLDEATERGRREGVDVRWLSGHAEELPLPDSSVDACFTERVLKYLPDPADGIAEMSRVLAPGGRLVGFELDQHATVLTGDPESASLVNEMLCAPLGEARMGRRLPGLLADAGLTGISHQVVTFPTPPELTEILLYQPAREALAAGTLPERVSAWLDEQAAAAAAGLPTVTWVGCLAGGTLP